MHSNILRQTISDISFQLNHTDGGGFSYQTTFLLEYRFKRVNHPLRHTNIQMSAIICNTIHMNEVRHVILYRLQRIL